MASRGRNPVRSFRLGAVVLLAMAGTAATLVVSEWPLIGQSIAGKASRSQVAAGGAEHGTLRAVPASVRGLFMPDEPDPYAGLPEMMTAGSAAESRRITRLQQENAPPPRRVLGYFSDGEAVYGPPSLHDYFEWQHRTALGRMVDGVVARHAERSSGAGALDPKVTPQLQWPSFAGDGGERTTTTDGESSAIDLSELTVRFDRLNMPPIDDTPDFDVASVLRSSEQPDDRYRRPVVMDAAAGNDARLRVSKNSMIRASANGEAPGVIRDYVNLRLEQVWNLGGASSFSVGWQHQRGVMSNELPEPTVRQDALLLELKFGF